MSLLIYKTNAWSECFMEVGPTRLGMSTATNMIAKVWLALRNDSLDRVVRREPVARWLIDPPAAKEVHVVCYVEGRLQSATLRRGQEVSLGGVRFVHEPLLGANQCVDMSHRRIRSRA